MAYYQPPNMRINEIVHTNRRYSLFIRAVAERSYNDLIRKAQEQTMSK